MLPIIKKWDINIFKYYLLQQKVLRTIFESVFITKKFTQCKTLRTFKIGQLQSIFTSISHPYLFTKSLRLTLPSSISQQFFNFFFFFVQLSQQSTPKTFSQPEPLSQFRLRWGISELVSLVRTGIVLNSSFFLKAWTVITGLTITDTLSPRLRKLAYSRY